MGLMLISAVIFISIAIYQNINDGEVVEETLETVTPTNEQCRGRGLKLPSSGVIVSSQLDGNNISITMNEGVDGVQKLYIIDYCNGRIISEISVKP